MKNRILIPLIIILALSVFGCKRPDPIPTPLPTDYIEIPEYINSPDRIEYWHRQVGSKWVSDKETFGYEDYRVTPVEFTISEVPDVNKPGTIIKKIPFRDDCDGFANFNPYVAYSVLDYDAYIAIIPEFSEPNISHMISFGKGPNGKFVVVNSPWISTQYSSIDEYMQTAYPDKRLGNITPIETYLEKLYSQGHHRYCN